MGESGGTQMARFLGGRRKLVLSHDWEDQDPLDPGAPRDGTLPGPGYTTFFLTVSPVDEIDIFDDKDALQTFHFEGGGDLDGREVPPKVKEAFDRWYRELSHESARRGLTIEYEGRLGSEEAVDRILGMIKGASPHLPILLDEPSQERVAEERARHRAGRVKGFSMRTHQSGDQLSMIFVDRGSHWAVTGSVKTHPVERPEDEAKIIWLLGIMKYEGAELTVSERASP
jgi:hypothetical protein